MFRWCLIIFGGWGIQEMSGKFQKGYSGTFRISRFDCWFLFGNLRELRLQFQNGDSNFRGTFRPAPKKRRQKSAPGDSFRGLATFCLEPLERHVARGRSLRPW